MSAAVLIYLASITNGISGLIACTGIAMVGVSVTYAVFTMDNTQNDRNKEASRKPAYTFFKRVFPAGMILIAISIFIPDKETIYLMAGAKITQDIVTSPESKEIGNKILKVINQKLDEVGK